MFSLSRPSKQETKGLILSGFVMGAACHSQRLGFRQTPQSSHKAVRDPQPPGQAHRPTNTRFPSPDSLVPSNSHASPALEEMPTGWERNGKGDRRAPEKALEENLRGSELEECDPLGH